MIRVANFFAVSIICCGTTATGALAGASEDYKSDFLLQTAEYVSVHRGVQEQANHGSSVSRTVTAGVTVVRGPAILRRPPSAGRPAGPLSAPVQVGAGDDLWFYDPIEEKVSACRLVKAGTVSAFRIRCFQRRVHF